ncbi:DUF5701 family protein [Nocardioides halotolerans]|uniref:DUF5701 family protein n=1 Tax=Nocardioides halotolerans TaxID=433660 RepID=UPI000427027E|nr:DUF5701 family protein [Nocardioides halotolerans]
MLLDDELARQAEVLVGLGYPDHLRAEAKALLDPLRDRLGDEVASEPAHASFVLVPGPSVLPVSQRVPMLRLAGRAGTLSAHFADVDTFGPVVEVPHDPVYAVVRVERGEDLCGVSPADAATSIAGRGRTMLTMEEGIAFLHAVPAALEKNKCFHTGASRGSDRRVPALWISARAPHLGWCWEHNHHTWLGVASAENRVTRASA